MPVATVEYEGPYKDGRPASMDFVVTITGQQGELLGGPAERADVGEFGHLVVWALLLLRSLERHHAYCEPPDPDSDLAHLRGVLRALDGRLLPRLNGIRDAVIRHHQQRGGSITQLADAMGVARSTAQSRAEALMAADPSPNELWARGMQRAPQGPAPTDPAAEIARLRRERDDAIAEADALRTALRDLRASHETPESED